jgi:hypothetical protein
MSDAYTTPSIALSPEQNSGGMQLQSGGAPTGTSQLQQLLQENVACCPADVLARPLDNAIFVTLHCQ